MSKQRFCIFCGKSPPIDKNKEHIIPSWLIEMTGDPSRPMYLGPFLSRKELREKTFAFKNFEFPSCSKCNGRFSKLEGSVKPIVKKLLANAKEVSGNEFDILLDWFDKVRVGLWLGYHHFLDKNHWGIDPNFYIEDRIGTSDRILLIYTLDSGQAKGINFAGVSTPAFAHMPSCFTLTINQLCFINISTDYLLAKQLGLPYPEKTEFTVEDEAPDLTKFYLVSGTENLSIPILDFNLDSECTIIAQSVFGKALKVLNEPDLSNLYETDYVNNLKFSQDSTKSKLLAGKKDNIAFYAPNDAVNLVRDFLHDPVIFFDHIYIRTMQIQNSLLRRAQASGEVPDSKVEFAQYSFENCIRANEFFIALVVNNSPNFPVQKGKIPRNDPCPCDDGRKYKHCCGRFTKSIRLAIPPPWQDR